MITADGKHLIVLEDMSIDFDLPKYKKRVKAKGNAGAGGLDDEDSDVSEDSDSNFHIQPRFRLATGATFTNGLMVNTSIVDINGANAAIAATTVSERKGLFSKLAFWRRKPTAVVPTSTPNPQMTIQEFFEHVKNSQQELTVVTARAAGYEVAMNDARRSGQSALLEKLTDGLNAYRMETQLVAIGLNKFVAEQDIVEFYKQSKKGLRLDYVANFTRIIPAKIIAKQHRANELGLFDNYVILHYDPHAKSFAETEAEKAARKDPILFGLMKGRRQLYVVGDWVDEVCDLTLDQLAEVLGKEAVQELKPV